MESSAARHAPELKEHKNTSTNPMIYYAPYHNKGQYTLHHGMSAIFDKKVLIIKNSANKDIFRFNLGFDLNYLTWLISHEDGLVIFGNQYKTLVYDVKNGKLTDFPYIHSSVKNRLETITILNERELVCTDAGKFAIYNINSRQLKEDKDFSPSVKLGRVQEVGLGYGILSYNLGKNSFLIGHLGGIARYQWTGTKFQENSIEQFKRGETLQRPDDSNYVNSRNVITLTTDVGRGCFRIWTIQAGDMNPILTPCKELPTMTDTAKIYFATADTAKSYFATALAFIPCRRKAQTDAQDSRTLCQQLASSLSCRKKGE